jgi:hypothetical protein
VFYGSEDFSKRYFPDITKWSRSARTLPPTSSTDVCLPECGKVALVFEERGDWSDNELA